MGKLEDIPKKQVFTVPEDYFEKLPAQIQSCISIPKAGRTIRPVFRYALQYALPVLVVFVVGLYFFKPSSPADTESILASVETADLVSYLNDSELSTEDLLEQIDFSTSDLDAIEGEVYDFYPEDTEGDEVADEI